MRNLRRINPILVGASRWTGSYMIVADIDR
jgi:hypothetical protein